MDEKEFIKLVIKSLEAIEKQFRIPYEKRPYERIICYEFYHQLRKCLDEKNFSLILHGELDKRYRDIKKIPDFVLHLPGEDLANFAVLEFKSTRSGARWIKYDLKKLDEFRMPPLSYQMGILVIFGERNELNRVYEKLRETSIGIKTKLNIVLYDLNIGKVILSTKIIAESPSSTQ